MYNNLYEPLFILNKSHSRTTIISMRITSALSDAQDGVLVYMQRTFTPLLRYSCENIFPFYFGLSCVPVLRQVIPKVVIFPTYEFRLSLDTSTCILLIKYWNKLSTTFVCLLKRFLLIQQIAEAVLLALVMSHSIILFINILVLLWAQTIIYLWKNYF